MSAKFTRPYVEAFFAVAKDPAAELMALEGFRAAYDLTPELEKVLSNPGLERGKREALLAAVAARSGVPDLAGRLLTILLRNGRLAVLGELLAAIRARLDRDTRAVEARLVTAQPADEATLEALRALVAARTKKTVRLVAAVDPALLGGFVVSVGSARLDIAQGSFRDGYLPFSGPAVKELVAGVRDGFDPDLIISPRVDDLHQDHALLGALTHQVFLPRSLTSLLARAH